MFDTFRPMGTHHIVGEREAKSSPTCWFSSVFLNPPYLWDDLKHPLSNQGDPLYAKRDPYHFHILRDSYGSGIREQYRCPGAPHSFLVSLTPWIQVPPIRRYFLPPQNCTLSVHSYQLITWIHRDPKPTDPSQLPTCQPGGKRSIRYPMLLGAVRQDVRFTVTSLAGPLMFSWFWKGKHTATNHLGGIQLAKKKQCGKNIFRYRYQLFFKAGILNHQKEK